MDEIIFMSGISFKRRLGSPRMKGREGTWECSTDETTGQE